MLVLFVLVIVLLHNKMVDIENERKATQEQIDKITEIEEAVKKIDTTYFEYNEKYKKHRLKIQANFKKDKYLEKDLGKDTIIQLVNAGDSIRDFITDITKKYPAIQYLLIIEGQASKDSASDVHNYELSYKRAYTLKQIWKEIDFGENCEILISGSGTGGTRDSIESKNQRFLIHIIPKPGIIEQASNNQ
jgi:outer membrane protein OmpA-like peptidoglycan-associated protein